MNIIIGKTNDMAPVSKKSTKEVTEQVAHPKNQERRKSKLVTIGNKLSKQKVQIHQFKG